MSGLPVWNFWVYEVEDSGWDHEHFGRDHLEEMTADDTAWGRKVFWSAEEATALSFGLSPDEISSDELSGEDVPLARHYTNLLEMIEEAQEVKMLSDPIRPREYVIWARGNGVSLPEDLEKEITKRDTDIDVVTTENETLKEQINALKTENASLRFELDVQRGRANEASEQKGLARLNKPLGVRERLSFYKIIVGMAITHHGYKPDGSKQPIARSIKSDLDLAAIKIDDEPILNALRNGVEALKEDGWNPEPADIG